MSLLSTLKDKATELTVEQALVGLSTLALPAIYFFGDLVDTHIAPVVLSSVSPQALVRTLVLAAVLAAIGLTYLFLRVFLKNGLRLKYGIYWDDDKNPHCPVCKSPVAYDEWAFYGYGYCCKACNQIFTLADAEGNKYTPADVLKKL